MTCFREIPTRKTIINLFRTTALNRLGFRRITVGTAVFQVFIGYILSTLKGEILNYKSVAVCC